MTSIEIRIRMDRPDFGQLFDVVQEWAASMDGTAKAPDSGFRSQVSDGRFVSLRLGRNPETTWAWAYWADNWAAIMLGRAFLEAWGDDYDVVTDEAGGWAILTDYAAYPELQLK